MRATSASPAGPTTKGRPRPLWINATRRRISARVIRSLRTALATKGGGGGQAGQGSFRPFLRHRQRREQAYWRPASPPDELTRPQFHEGVPSPEPVVKRHRHSTAQDAHPQARPAHRRISRNAVGRGGLGTAPLRARARAMALASAEPRPPGSPPDCCGTGAQQPPAEEDADRADARPAQGGPGRTRSCGPKGAAQEHRSHQDRIHARPCLGPQGKRRCAGSRSARSGSQVEEDHPDDEPCERGLV